MNIGQTLGRVNKMKDDTSLGEDGPIEIELGKDYWPIECGLSGNK